MKLTTIARAKPLLRDSLAYMLPSFVVQVIITAHSRGETNPRLSEVRRRSVGTSDEAPLAGRRGNTAYPVTNLLSTCSIYRKSAWFAITDELPQLTKEELVKLRIRARRG